MFKNLTNVFNRNKKVIQYGLITNTTIGVLLRGVGDFIQQNIEIKNSSKNVTINSSKNETIINSQETIQKLNWIRTSNVKYTSYVLFFLNLYKNISKRKLCVNWNIDRSVEFLLVQIFGYSFPQQNIQINI